MIDGETGEITWRKDLSPLDSLVRIATHDLSEMVEMNILMIRCIDVENTENFYFFQAYRKFGFMYARSHDLVSSVRPNEHIGLGFGLDIDAIWNFGFNVLLKLSDSYSERSAQSTL